MITRFFFLLLLFCLFFSVQARAISSHNLDILNTYIHTRHLELKPASLKNSYQIASVCFAGNVGVDCRELISGNYSDSETLCKINGFTQSGNCSANEKPGQYCSIDATYYDRCCNKAYNYTSSNCIYPNTLSSESCSGKRKCICDKRLYPSSSCTAPEVFKDSNDYCKEVSYTSAGVPVGTTYYTGCKCPDNYQICGKNQKGVGEACQSQYFAECKCDTKYDSTCSDFGPQNGHQLDFCLMDGTKYYQKAHCKTCPNLGQYDSCPDGYTCILEACSFKYYLAGCAVGYSPVGNCPWMEYFTKTMPLPTLDVE